MLKPPVLICRFIMNLRRSSYRSGFTRWDERESAEGKGMLLEKECGPLSDKQTFNNCLFDTLFWDWLLTKAGESNATGDMMET